MPYGRVAAQGFQRVVAAFARVSVPGVARDSVRFVRFILPKRTVSVVGSIRPVLPGSPVHSVQCARCRTGIGNGERFSSGPISLVIALRNAEHCFVDVGALHQILEFLLFRGFQSMIRRTMTFVLTLAMTLAMFERGLRAQPVGRNAPLPRL